ncbi:LysR substrate-binding domain-containing protein [Hydrogenophaga sp. BPS33]|uniref:LysR substrate-binding domain-containing protein n=1 Tax=Hydrogenophaga sp. BPS33 TaxID=2651974 RepID=UPI00131FF76D|nr:LysR substrate-binding domain-containing protein [Hydrogenophaga sp. BPS33]QHE84690.1 LysR family transcriptional regulator [Hydrogenophaga sp. BPS33]
MTLQQLRAICEIVANGFSVTRAADVMCTTQPAVSKLVALIEGELGGEIFVRSRSRIIELTELGEEVIVLARRMLNDSTALGDIAAERFQQTKGVLHIATSHAHARYVLLPAIKVFRKTYEEVDLVLKQQTPSGIVAMVLSGECQFGLGTLPTRMSDDIVALPAYPIERCIITPLGHPLTKCKKLKLEDVARYPLVGYEQVAAAGRAVMDSFRQAGLRPRTIIRAPDADFLKGAVAAGLGVSIIQSTALDPDQDSNIAILPARGLFPATSAYLTLRRGSFLRGYTYDLISLIAPSLSRADIQEAMRRN